MQRPKLDHYDGYRFYVIHALNHETLEMEEVDIFKAKDLSSPFIYTKHPVSPKSGSDCMLHPTYLKRAWAHFLYDHGSAC